MFCTGVLTILADIHPHTGHSHHYTGGDPYSDIPAYSLLHMFPPCILKWKKKIIRLQIVYYK